MRIRLLGHYLHVVIVWTLVGDLAASWLALALAEWVRSGGAAHIASLPLLLLSAVFGGTYVMFALALGIYTSRQRVRPAGVILRTLVSLFAATAVTYLTGRIVPHFYMPVSALVVGATDTFCLSVLMRLSFLRALDEDAIKRRVLIYGAGRLASAVLALRRRADRRGFYLVGYVAAENERTVVPPGQLIEAAQSLLEVCRQHRVDEIVVAMDDRRRGFPVNELLDARMAGTDVTDIVTFLERETGKVRLDVLNPTWIIFGEGFRRGDVRRWSIRLLDVTASLGVLLLALPVMLLTILAIKLEDGFRAPVFYRQTRVGLLGSHFQVLKFRSMRTDAEQAGAPKWAVQGDSRVTRVGAFIRKLRIDEIPQVLNVFRGEMSFVGPRPERPEFVEQLSESIPYYRERHWVKPGITGWAQLCYPYGSSELDAAEKLQYDLYYVKNQSLIFDVLILLQTAEVVLFGKGAR
jgi:sugar transferase (PEP-CTERM system associated)